MRRSLPLPNGRLAASVHLVEAGQRLLRWLAGFGLLSLILFLAFYHLNTYPPTSYDEGAHLMAARDLALRGQYTFGPALGPVVIFSMAAVIKLLGAGLVPARLVMAGYLLLSLAAFYALARRLGDWKVSLAATALYLVSGNAVSFGRQVLGEVPATLFTLGWLLVWFSALDEPRPGRRRALAAASGALLGLAILSKNQFALLLPAWLALWVLDWLYYRQAGHWDFALPLAAALLCVAAWFVGQRLFFPNGQELAASNSEQWRAALSRGMLTLSPPLAAQAIKFLTGPEALFGLALPAGLYAALRGLGRSRASLHWALLFVVSAVWLAWFTFFSVGWPRYAFLPLTLAAIFLAHFFSDVTGGFRLPAREWRAAAAGQWDLGLAARTVLLVLFGLLLARGLVARLGEVVRGGSDAPQQMASYIAQHVPAGAALETYEPEICFLSDHACHLPPSAMMDVSIQHAWYGGPAPFEFYHFQDFSAPYLLIGTFGRWVEIYDMRLVNQNYDRVTTIGVYDLYRLKTTP